MNSKQSAPCGARLPHCGAGGKTAILTVDFFKDAYLDQPVEQCELFGITHPDTPSSRTEDLADRYCRRCDVLFHAWDAQTTHEYRADASGVGVTQITPAPGIFALCMCTKLLCALCMLAIVPRLGAPIRAMPRDRAILELILACTGLQGSGAPKCVGIATRYRDCKQGLDAIKNICGDDVGRQAQLIDSLNAAAVLEPAHRVLREGGFAGESSKIKDGVAGQLEALSCSRKAEHCGVATNYGSSILQKIDKGEWSTGAHQLNMAWPNRTKSLGGAAPPVMYPKSTIRGVKKQVQALHLAGHTNQIVSLNPRRKCWGELHIPKAWLEDAGAYIESFAGELPGKKNRVRKPGSKETHVVAKVKMGKI
jgi:hypothetical protein